MKSRRAALLLFAWVFAGCDGKPPPVPVGDAGTRDAGRQTPRDAGPVRDSGRPEDSGTAPDAGPRACTVDPDRVYKVGSDRAGDRTVALAASGSGFGALYTGLPEDGLVARVHAIALSSDGTLGEPRQLSRAGTALRAVSLASTGASWIASWVDNDPDRYEVRTLPLGADLAPAAETPAAVTATPAGEDAPTLLVSERVLLAWIEDDLAGARVVRVRELGSDGAPTGSASAASDPAHQPAALVMGELSAGPVLLYPSTVQGSSGPETRIFLQGLTSTGGMRGSAMPLDRSAIADGTLDASLAPSGGAVVFGVLVGGARHEVRFRAVGGDGMPLRDERVLVEGTDASIAAFAGGYAVSYRAPASGATPAQVRLLLLNELGDVVAEEPVADAMPEGGRTTVRVAGDGQIAVAWADSTGDETSVRLALIACGGGS